MKKWLSSLFASLALGGVVHAEPVTAAMTHEKGSPGFTEHYVMLYYKDITSASNFYGNVLGLSTTLDDEWVKLYEVFPGSLIGLIKEGGTAYHKSQDTNAVMVSLVTEDVDAWYRRIQERPDIVILKAIYNHESVPMRAFLMADPGGYTVEIFQWLK